MSTPVSFLSLYWALLSSQLLSRATARVPDWPLVPCMLVTSDLCIDVPPTDPLSGCNERRIGWRMTASQRKRLCCEHMCVWHYVNIAHMMLIASCGVHFVVEDVQINVQGMIGAFKSFLSPSASLSCPLSLSPEKIGRNMTVVTFFSFAFPNAILLRLSATEVFPNKVKALQIVFWVWNSEKGNVCSNKIYFTPVQRFEVEMLK